MKSRVICDSFATDDECLELTHLHEAFGVSGYTDGLTTCGWKEYLSGKCHVAVLPMLRMREKIRDAVEQQFGREGELFAEFTATMGWHAGSSINEHYDSNREYLRQRHFSAILYLNDFKSDFDGGEFYFTSPEGADLCTDEATATTTPTENSPTSHPARELVHPLKGRLLAFDSGESNVHGVLPVVSGDRYTLTCWFTLWTSHCEDVNLLPMLTKIHALSAMKANSDEIPVILPMQSDIQRRLAKLQAAWRTGVQLEGPTTLNATNFGGSTCMLVATEHAGEPIHRFDNLEMGLQFASFCIWKMKLNGHSNPRVCSRPSLPLSDTTPPSAWWDMNQSPLSHPAHRFGDISHAFKEWSEYLCKLRHHFQYNIERWEVDGLLSYSQREVAESSQPG